MMDKDSSEEKYLTTEKEVKVYLESISNQEQVYSIALFDILGFSNFVANNGMEVIQNLYNKLLELIQKQSSSDGELSVAGSVVPVPVSDDWRQSVFIADANGYINVCHFSDTFLIYVNYQLSRPGYWLSTPKNEPFPLLLGECGTLTFPIVYQKHPVYLSFLQTCMDFFCQSIVAGIPLRGCVSTGLAVMNQYKSIYLGSTLVEAARGEPVQNALGISFGKSFNNSHPVYNDYFIPYLDHIKKESKNKDFLSPMVLDWARYWRNTPDYKNLSFSECIKNMNTNSEFSSYYDNAIKFYDFSANHESWSHEVNREGIKDIIDYYDRVREWYISVV